MTAQLSVLYDHPGPKAKARYRALSVVFTILLALLLWWVLAKLNSKQELTAAKWKPFTSANVWSNFLWLGLWGTIKAAVLSVVIALPIGAIFAVGRLSDHVWLRWPCAVVVEFFRAARPSEQAGCHLTPHELRLLKLLVEGHNYKTAAVKLGLSVNTVSFHVRKIYEKLQVHSKSQAVAKALKQRLV